MSLTQIFIILLRRSWIVVTAFITTAFAAGVLLMIVPPRYDATATATVDASQSDPITGQPVGITGLRIQQGNLVALAKSQRVAQEVVRRLNLTSNPTIMNQYNQSDSFGRMDAREWIATDLLRSLDARFNEGSNVLVITYRSPNPILSAQVANTFLAAFTDAALEARVSGAQQTAQWFEPQTDRLRQEVEEARQRISRFQSAQRLTPVAQGGGSPELATLQQITGELAATRSEILKVKSALDQNGEVSGGETAPQPFDSTLMQSLKNTLSNVRADIGRLQSSVGANNPRLVALNATQRSLQSQINAERTEIRASLERRLKTLEAQAVSLDSARQEQLATVIAVQEQRDQLALLERDLEVRQERYLGAMRASSSARLQGQLSFSNISPLDRAVVPVSPSFPKMIQVIPATIVAGLGLGFILALLVEALGRKIRVPRDLEYAVGAPMLGILMPARGALVARR